MLPTQVGNCSQYVKVDGLVPDCEVEVFQAGNLVGSGRTNRYGYTCMGIRLRGQDEAGTLSARMIVCGNSGPLGTTPIVTDGALPKPTIGSPLYGCQRIVPLDNLRRGARVRMETNTGTDLGSICTCWQAVHVRVLHEMVTGEQVQAR